MATTVKVLVPSKVMENTSQNQYSASNITAMIDKCTITNTSAANVDFSLNIVPAGGAVSDANALIKGKTLAPNQTYNCPEIVGHSIQKNASIYTICSTAASLTLRISGREIT